MRASVLAVAVTAAACSGTRDGDAVAVRDSAGVRIVESSAPAWDGGGWRLGDATLEIRGGGEDAMIAEATAGARMADGTIAVRSGPTRIRYYDADGTPIRTVGAEGTFARILSIERLGRDSLLVYDYGTNRLTTLGPDGGVGGSIAAPVLGRGLPPHRPHRLPDGTIVGAASRGPQPLATFLPEALLRDSVMVYRHWPESGRTDTLAALPHVEVFVRVEGATRGSVPYPFGRTSVLGVSRGRIIVGSGDAPEVRVLDHEGRLIEIFRWSAAPEPVTDADLNAYVAAARAALVASPGDLRERTIARIMAAPRPAQKAPYGQLRVDEDGNLWLGAPAAFGGEPDRWTVLSADGRWLGAVDPPDAERLLHIGREHVLTRWRSETGEERIRVRPLVRP